MADLIKLKKGPQANLPNLNLAEPAFTTDEERLYIGGLNGNVPLPNKQDITTINSQLAEKANKSYVDTQIQAVASGSPKGVYATLKDLQTAFPTGTTGIFIVQADGKWYYWNGSAWIAGGTYQSTGIAERSITLKQLDWDLFDKIIKSNSIITPINTFDRIDPLNGATADGDTLVIPPGVTGNGSVIRYQNTNFVNTRDRTVKLIVKVHKETLEYIAVVPHLKVMRNGVNITLTHISSAVYIIGDLDRLYIYTYELKKGDYSLFANIQTVDKTASTIEQRINITDFFIAEDISSFAVSEHNYGKLNDEFVIYQDFDDLLNAKAEVFNGAIKIDNNTFKIPIGSTGQKSYIGADLVLYPESLKRKHKIRIYAVVNTTPSNDVLNSNMLKMHIFIPKAGEFDEIPVDTVTLKVNDNVSILYCDYQVTGNEDYIKLRVQTNNAVAVASDTTIFAGGFVYSILKDERRILNYQAKEGIEEIVGRVLNKANIQGMIDASLNNIQINPIPSKGQILYIADTKGTSKNHIVNACAYDDGTIIACRSDGKVVRIGYDGTEEILLSLTGSRMDWRLCWKDSKDNVYVSPHASLGTMQTADRGLYKLVKGASSFTKVISLYNTNSSIPTETQTNDDTIWTMAEDKQGNLYAGVYAHTIRANPAIYKSTDGGNTWTYAFNFNTSGLTRDGMHIHSIIYSQWKDALYAIVGEANTIFKSTDGGATWNNLNILLTVKGSAMLATPFGIFIGSDGAYNCGIDVLYPDDVTHKKVFSGWANTVFAIRRSDITGFLYAFTKIDSSVNSTSYFPPADVLNASTEDEMWNQINKWKASVSADVYNTWKAYYDSVIDTYPEDAVRPQHYGILISRDGGRNWEILKRFKSVSTGPYGFWTASYFNNGECLTGRYDKNGMDNPIVISEGKHKYVNGGCDLDGEIYVRTNTSTIANII